MNATDVTIAAERADQPDVLRLIEELDALQLRLYPEESCHFVDVSGLLANDVIFLVARLSGNVVGCGAVLCTHDHGEIKRMFVSTAARGHGLGMKIVTALEVATAERDISLLRLETGIHQPDAIRLYEKCGYAKCGPFGDYTDDPLSVFMEKTLS